MLFDRYERTQDHPATNSEPIFHALNRLAWKNAGNIRDVLDGWFAAFPASHQDTLRSRFRSDRDADLQGAFFELGVHRLLVQLGYEVQVNPRTDRGQTPDFLAGVEEAEQFYVEATVVEPRTFQDSPREKLVFDELNKLRSPDFWLFAKSVRGTLASNPPLRKMRESVQEWIDGLRWESAHVHSSSGTCQPFQLEHDGWTLQLDARPKGEEARGKPARPLSGPVRSAFVNSAEPLVRAVQGKAKEYKNLGAPLIVALNCLDRSGVDQIDVLLALFGWEGSSSEPNSARVSPPSGVQKRECIWDAKKNTGVSAVLLFNGFLPSSMATAPVCLYENPWAARPAPTSLRRLPHATVGGGLIRWHEGEALCSILNLPLDWPGPK